MNKKIATVSIVLIALMSLSLFPAAFAWHTPCSADDELYEEFGPRPSQILIKVYTSYTTELEGFKGKEVDVMDWALEPVDYQWFEANDPNHAQYSTAFYAEFGAFQYDLNCQVMPTMLVSVRQALAHILDKDYFINTYLSGMGKKLDSVLNYLGAPWFAPATTNKYNIQPRTTMVPFPDDPLDWEAAFDLLLADLGPPVPDPENPGDFMFWWPSPFPDYDPTNVFPPVADGHLLVYARSEMDPRTQQGIHLENCLEVTLPNILDLLGKPRTRIYVDLQIQPRSVCRPQCMGYYRYHLYTGGWILNRDPDFLMYYTTGMITKPDLYGQNYVMYANPSFDAEVDAMLVSAEPGTSGDPCDGVYHAWLAQEIMEEDEPVIWMWATAGYKAYLSNWRGMVNQIGFGMNSWWSFLNAYKLGGTGCGDLIRYGFAGDILSLNIFGAQFYWDYEVLGKIYDGLIAVNPYNMADDRPYLASWELGTWTDGVNTYSKLIYHLRDDVFWQNIPYYDRSLITAGNTHAADGPFEDYQLNPLDVAFSWVYQRDNVNSWSGWLAAIIQNVAVHDCWEAYWPWTDGVTLPPWWNLDPVDWQYDYMTFDEEAGLNDIVVYCNVFMPWLANHWLGGMYMVPMHLWMYVPIDGSEAIDTWGYDMVYGTSDYILLSRNPGVDIVMIENIQGASYRGTTIKNGFFYQAIRAASGVTQKVTVTGQKVIFQKRLTDYRIGADAATPITVYWKFTYKIQVWNEDLMAWVDVMEDLNLTPEQGSFTTLGGQTTNVIFGVKLPTTVGFCNWIRIHKDFHWWYHLPCTKDYQGYEQQPYATDPFCYEQYYSYVRHVHPPDIFGTALGDDYAKSDKIINIKDATPIGIYWMQTVPAGDYLTDKAIADMNNDGIINIKDATPIGIFWMYTWSGCGIRPRWPTISLSGTGAPKRVTFTATPCTGTVEVDWEVKDLGEIFQDFAAPWKFTAGVAPSDWVPPATGTYYVRCNCYTDSGYCCSSVWSTLTVKP